MYISLSLSLSLSIYIYTYVCTHTDKSDYECRYVYIMTKQC